MILEFSIFKPFSDRLVHGVTTKQMGSFNDEEESLSEQLKKLPAENPIFSRQIHSDKVIWVKSHPNIPFQGDSFITQQKNTPLAVKVADCQGILMFDPITNSISAVHCGWRSSSLNIIGKTVQKMKKLFKTNPSDLLVGISPSLGPCCAQFNDPKKELPAFAEPHIQNQNVDFWSLSLDQLKEAGVPENQVELMKECTKCQPDKYYSHRNADNGRMAVFISLTS